MVNFCGPLLVAIFVALVVLAFQNLLGFGVNESSDKSPTSEISSTLRPAIKGSRGPGEVSSEQRKHLGQHNATVEPPKGMFQCGSTAWIGVYKSAICFLS